MNLKVVAALIIAIIVCSAGVTVALSGIPSASEDLVCPEGAHDITGQYVLTPIGTRSENFMWTCLRCGESWIQRYAEDAYEAWRDAFLEPDFVRNYAMLYLRAVLEMKVPDPLTINWTGGRATPEGLLGYETYVYESGDVSVTVGYPVVLPENTEYTITVKVHGVTVWKGTLLRREFKSSSPFSGENGATYDYYGGVGVFERGVHVIATSQDPSLPTGEADGDYWRALKEHEATVASPEDFVSIIVSRGDFSTGGYTIQVKKFSYIESDPVKLRFEVNVTDPGEGVAVTQALTNPLVLIPLGNLDPGEYEVQVHVDAYVLTYGENGEPIYTQLLTFREELWTATFTVE